MGEKKMKIGLLPRLLIAIVLGILIGSFMPEVFCRIIITLSGLFSTFLSFIIPLMIVAYVSMGIAGLTSGAGALLLVTFLLAYGSSLICGSLSFIVASTIFPSFISPDVVDLIVQASSRTLDRYFSIPVSPILDTTAAVVLAFTLGLCISVLRSKKQLGDSLYNSLSDFSKIIDLVLNRVIVPGLPLLICGTFVNMTYSGQTAAILGVLWKVFLIVIIMHLVYLLFLFIVAGSVGKKNPFFLLRNQVRGYLTAIGTQSSAATIPVNLQCAEADGISEEVREFVVPVCANIHMAGSMITITACATSVCLMYDLPIGLNIVIPFIAMLGIAMVASPGAPGGSIMTALPFLYMIFGREMGDVNGPLCAIMIALYLTQDSFGTACNVSGDNAIGVIVDTIAKKMRGTAPANQSSSAGE